MSGSEILVVLSRPEAAAACLHAAADAARALPSPHLAILYVRVDSAATILPSEEVLTGERRSALLCQEAADRAALHAAWVAWQPTAPPSTWTEVDGIPAEQVPPRAQAAALVVMALPGPHPPHLERNAFDAVLFESGRPVLAVPADWSGRFGLHLAVGWRDTPGTRRALAAASPWLAAAAQLSAIEIADAPAAPPPSPPAGADAAFTCRTVPPAGRSDGAALLAAAIEAGADGLVLGTYRRGRMLEWMLGGVTEHVLRHATLPLLLRH